MACENSLGSIWPDDLYFVVPASGGSYVNDGGQIIALPSRFDGWKLRVVRNNAPLDMDEQVVGDPYWEHVPASNSINLSNDATTGDKFMIQAYKPIL
jgi:hypothetical protein